VRRLVLLVIVFAVQFGLFEAGLRMAGGSEAAPGFQSLFIPDPRIGHRLRPGTSTRYSTSEFSTEISINSAGVRGPEFAGREPGERRVVVLGDSLVMAVQVDAGQTFCAALERRLNARDPAHRYRVINAGVQGYGPVQEWLFYEHVVSAFAPDVVLVAVFVANDATEALDAAPRLAEPAGAATPDAEEAQAALRRLVRRSMVLQTVRMRVEALRARLETQPVAERPLAAYLDSPPPEIARGLEVSRAAVDRIAERAAADGAATALVLVPARFQLEDGDYGRLAEIVRQSGGTLVRQAATERFAAALAPLGLPMLDLVPVLQAEPDPGALFFTENIHFTPRGHEVVGQALDEFLARERLFDRRPAPPAPTVAAR
jgi:lysophospholipase L1-like esterase